MKETCKAGFSKGAVEEAQLTLRSFGDVITASIVADSDRPGGSKFHTNLKDEHLMMTRSI